MSLYLGWHTWETLRELARSCTRHSWEGWRDTWNSHINAAPFIIKMYTYLQGKGMAAEGKHGRAGSGEAWGSRGLGPRPRRRR